MRLPKRPPAPTGGRGAYFSISVATLSVSGSPAPLRVPIYRCGLAEVMVARLRAVPEGEQLAAMLEAPPLEGMPGLIAGPDLEAITTTACTEDRRQRSCAPCFSQVLAGAGGDPSPPSP